MKITIRRNSSTSQLKRTCAKNELVRSQQTKSERRKNWSKRDAFVRTFCFRSKTRRKLALMVRRLRQNRNQILHTITCRRQWWCMATDKPAINHHSLPWEMTTSGRVVLHSRRSWSGYEKLGHTNPCGDFDTNSWPCTNCKSSPQSKRYEKRAPLCYLISGYKSKFTNSKKAR